MDMEPGTSVSRKKILKKKKKTSRRSQDDNHEEVEEPIDVVKETQTFHNGASECTLQYCAPPKVPSTPMKLYLRSKLRKLEPTPTPIELLGLKKGLRNKWKGLSSKKKLKWIKKCIKRYERYQLEIGEYKQTHPLLDPRKIPISEVMTKAELNIWADGHGRPPKPINTVYGFFLKEFRSSQEAEGRSEEKVLQLAELKWSLLPKMEKDRHKLNFQMQRLDFHAGIEKFLSTVPVPDFIRANVLETLPKKYQKQFLDEVEKGPLVKEEDLLVKEKDLLVKEEDLLVKEEDLLVNEEDWLVKEEDLLVKEEDLLVKEDDNGEIFSGTVLSYEGPRNKKVDITPNDINGLGYSQFLNEKIMDFWLAMLQTERLSDEDKQKTFVFGCSFYKKLTEKVKRKCKKDEHMTAGERRHARVKKHTKHVDIFSKDFLIIPINENSHWFIAIVCFPGLEGYHEYRTLRALPNYKRPRTANNTSSNWSTTSGNNKKPIVFQQPKKETTAFTSNREVAPEDTDEMDQGSSPDTLGTGGLKSKSERKTKAGGWSNIENGPSTSSGLKRKYALGEDVKHPCILIFDSLGGKARGQTYSTLREYLKIEYKRKKNSKRIFDKASMPGIMPKVPQQSNSSDCGLFVVQYVESFFSNPLTTFDPKEINLKKWFVPSSIAKNKRQEIYNLIVSKVKENFPQLACRIPKLSFGLDDNDEVVNELFAWLGIDI